MRKAVVSDEEFTMWRAVLAFALADGYLSLEDQALLNDHFKNIPFSKHQMAVLKEDVKAPQDSGTFYNGLRSEKYKKHFYAIARMLVHYPGDTAYQEKEILKRLSYLNRKDRDILNKTGQARVLRQYIRHYERISAINTRYPFPLFKTSA